MRVNTHSKGALKGRRVGRFQAPFVTAATLSALLAWGLAHRALPASGASFSDCDAHGESDGVSASAAAWCLYSPDGVMVEPLAPLDCALVTYEVAVTDDSVLAVFPNRIVRDYEPLGHGGPDDGLEAHGEEVVEPAGFDSHYGAEVDLYGAPANPDERRAPLSEASPAVRPALVVPVGDRLFSATGRWLNRICWNEGAGGLKGTKEGPFGEGPTRPLDDLIAAAAARVDPPPLPPVEFSGPTSVVNLPTWFWISDHWWEQDYSEVASHGTVSVEVRAQPVSWRIWADGEPLGGCEQRGVPFRQGVPENHPLACTITFSGPPPGWQTLLAVEVEMAVVWNTSLPRYGSQALESIRRSSVTDHEVVEIVGMRS